MNEITVQAKLNVNKGGLAANGDSTKYQTLAGNGAYTNTQTIGLTPELIEFPSDLLTEGLSYAWVKNGGTNTVELYMNSAGSQCFSQLGANDLTLVRKKAGGTDNYYACAFTGASEIKVAAAGT